MEAAQEVENVTKTGNKGTTADYRSNRRQYPRACGTGFGKDICTDETNRLSILELYVEPSSIVAMTFTNKAANEMKYRLKKMIGDFATFMRERFMDIVI